jgi:hypothetical protein
MKVLTLAEYSLLPSDIQSTLLLEQGIPLICRPPQGQGYTMLYSLGTFFVEVSWRPNWSLVEFNAFNKVDNLTPYLALIDWHELV